MGCVGLYRRTRAVFDLLTSQFQDLMRRGGVVMWPLLGLSLLGMTLAIERIWFWWRTNHPTRLARVAEMGFLLRQGDKARARAIAESDASVYGRVVRRVLDGGSPAPNIWASEAAAAEAVEDERPHLERFMPTLSTIITVAPMLGILGTVTGIISSFQVLSGQIAATDPRAVGQGIAEALLTTAAGLVVAIGALFPYNVFRVQLDRTLSRLESLAVAASYSAELGKGKGADGKQNPSPPE